MKTFKIKSVFNLFIKSVTSVVITTVITGSSLASEPTAIAQVTDFGGPHRWIFLWSGYNSADFSVTGNTQALGYVFIPKVGNVGFELLNQGHALRIHIPSLRQLLFKNDDLSEIKIPKKIPQLDPLIMGDQVELKIESAFSDWLKTLDQNETTVNFKDSTSANGVRSFKLSQLSVEELSKGVNRTISLGQESFISIISNNRFFSKTDGNAIASAFSLEIHQIMNGTKIETLKYTYPPNQALVELAGFKGEAFYQALDQIDAAFFQNFSRSSAVKEAGGPAFAEKIQRCFLEEAFKHYFIEDSNNVPKTSCVDGYKYRLRTASEQIPTSKIYEKNYFSPQMGELQIPLTPQWLE